MSKYVAPSHFGKRFNCPFCDAYAHHDWYINPTGTNKANPNMSQQFYSPNFSECVSCNKVALWIDEKMIFPASSNAPLPTDDMPEDVKEIFNEARTIVNISPRACAALLRLAIQVLMPHLGEKGKNIYTDIKKLVKKGLKPDVQKALDIVRVIGNSSVHPGQIDISDDSATANVLFELINVIVEKTITEQKTIDNLFNKLPDSQKEQIDKRDSNT